MYLDIVVPKRGNPVVNPPLDQRVMNHLLRWTNENGVIYCQVEYFVGETKLINIIPSITSDQGKREIGA